MVNYEIKYTNRKTLAIYITKDARVEVRCNKRVRKADIERFIFEKEKLPFIALLIPDITELDVFSPTPKK